MRGSRLPAGGTNLFQGIKAISAEAEAQGVSLFKLSIGQPAGPALLSARKAIADAVMWPDEFMFEYQDNDSPGVDKYFLKKHSVKLNFAESFVAGHLRTHLSGDVAYLATTGIKPMMGPIIEACGASLKIVATTTNPGYPTPKDQALLKGKIVFEPKINPQNQFLFDPSSLALDGLSAQVGLLMVNYPHNPSGAIVRKERWHSLCAFCSDHDIRMVNDAAYYATAYGEDNCSLAEVAVTFPALSWMELYSVSKLIGNGTDLRVGAAVGTPDFIGDLAKIKGNTDSGFFAPAAIGALEALMYDKESIRKVADLYHRRAEVLCRLLKKAGMCLALEPRAGFFTLWLAPKYAFGREMKDAKDFNNTMIKETGIVGVHFPPYIRYAVAHDDVESPEAVSKIEQAFAKAQVSY